MSPPAPSSDSYRERWIALVPFAALSVLAQVGALLGILFRTSPAADGGGVGLAAAYLLGLVPIPVLLLCLLVGYAGTRNTLLVVLWIYLVCTLANLPAVFGAKQKAAFGVMPFVLAQAGALWLGHGARLREAVGFLDRRRRSRWGPGLAWMLVIGVCGLFSTASVAVLGAVELSRAGGPNALDLPGILRLLPPAVGLGVATYGLSQITRSRAPMAWIAGTGLLLLAGVVLWNGLDSALGRFAAFVSGLEALVLLALTRPTLRTFCERQRGPARKRTRSR